MIPEPRIVGYSKNAVFERGMFEGCVGYLLWEIPEHTTPEPWPGGIRRVKTRIYKTPLPEFLRLMLK